jgi:hypothetical protein
MVDALRRAHRMVKPDGFVLDLHPSVTPASVEVGGATTGHIVSPDAKLRHAAAGVALAAVIDERLFSVDQAARFTFYTYADSIEELREYIAENWRDSRIEDRTVDLTRAALRGTRGVRPRSHEEVHIARLRPRHL